MCTAKKVALASAVVAFITFLIGTPILLTRNKSNAKYIPVTIELLPNRSVKIVQGDNYVSYSQKEFHKLHYGLEDCFQRKPSCNFQLENSTVCAYTAHVVEIDLCFGKIGRAHV